MTFSSVGNLLMPSAITFPLPEQEGLPPYLITSSFHICGFTSVVLAGEPKTQSLGPLLVSARFTTTLKVAGACGAQNLCREVVTKMPGFPPTLSPWKSTAWMDEAVETSSG